MANHIRRQIRERIGTLVTGLTTTSTRVYQSRVYALSMDTELPCLLVYTLREDISEDASSFCKQERAITVAIEAVAKATADLDDTLDLICKEVEIALATDKTLSGLAKRVWLTSVELQLQGADSLQPIGAARMSWNVRTTTEEGVPDVVA